jgi:SAM-dependent methyltransferase
LSDLKNRAARPTQSDVRHIWEERYQVPREPSSYEDDWLERWSDTLASVQGGQVLDAGCGPGGDTLRPMNHGLRVVGLDFSLGALKIARGHTRCPVVQSDVCDSIPFRSATFHLIVASLVLHYFNHDTTKSILRALRDCLVPGGRILMRLNSTDDVQFGAEGNPLVEPDVHLVGGVPNDSTTASVWSRYWGRAGVSSRPANGPPIGTLAPSDCGRSAPSARMRTQA